MADQLFEMAIWTQAPKEEFIDLTRTRKTGTLTFDLAVDSIARQLGAVDVIKLRGPEKENRLKTLLEIQRILIVLDNLETAKDPQNEIAGRLLPLLGHSKAILTSRQRFSGDLYTIHLEGLTEEGALAFIHQEADEKNISRVATAQTGELKDIATATGGSPLALKLVVGQLEFLDLETVLSLLQEVKPPQDGSDVDEYIQLYQNIFFSSWQLLSEISRHLLIAMANFSANNGGTPVTIAKIADLDSFHVTRSIRELWRRSFLEIGQSKGLKTIRYYLHALTQYFVLADILQIFDESDEPQVSNAG